MRLMYFFTCVVTLNDRPYGYEIVDNHEVNVILNSYDVSEYLKIAPHGLEVCSIC